MVSNTSSSLEPVNWNLAGRGLAGEKHPMTTRNLGGYIPFSSFVFSNSSFMASMSLIKKSTSVTEICEIKCVNYAAKALFYSLPFFWSNIQSSTCLVWIQGERVQVLDPLFQTGIPGILSQLNVPNPVAYHSVLTGRS